MRLGRILPITLFLVVAACGAIAVVSTSNEESPQFAAHEFAVLRSEYSSLRGQSASHRAELFRELRSTLETIEMTPGMAGSVAEFCEEVVGSGEERPEVKTEAKLALEVLVRHQDPGAPNAPNRVPAGAAASED